MQAEELFYIEEAEEMSYETGLNQFLSPISSYSLKYG